MRSTTDLRESVNNHEEGQLKTSDCLVFLSCIQDHISAQISSERQVLKLPAWTTLNKVTSQKTFKLCTDNAGSEKAEEEKKPYLNIMIIL
jgi:hypothetical protein